MAPTANTAGLPPLAGYHPTTLIDWPGRIAAIVFLPGCNLRCRFCHAGPLLAAPQETIPLEAVMEHIASREGWIDGVVICGGEPTIWPSLGALCSHLHASGLAVKLDTNGTHPDVLRGLARDRLIDAVAMDLKAPLDERYRLTCGKPDMDLDAVAQSIDFLMSSGLEYEFRTTMCPPLVGQDEVRDMGRRIAGAERWVLQRWSPEHSLDPALRSVRPYGPAEMEALAEIGRSLVARCLVRGQPEGA